MRARTDEAKDLRRQALLDAALDEFAERGFAAARMEDIARRADLSKGTLYLYFESKEDLFKALVDTKAAPRLDEIEALVTEMPSALEALATFAQLAPMLIQRSPVPRLAKIIIGESNQFPEIADFYRRNFIERGMGVIRSVLEQGVERGELEVEDPALTARLIMGPMVLSAVWHVLYGDKPDGRVDLEKLFALHARYLRRALVKREDEPT